ncbi:MAG TPA: hypothetical protein VFX03_01825 [Thermomicrobiales bacterium]|nr:hypothetical protein [Thermomicrobiales bacterium]
MTPEYHTRVTPAIAAALRELQDRIAARYPEATFAVEDGSDPRGIYLIATVDVPDTDVVFDLVVERLLELQIEDGLPIYVTPIRPIARVIAMLRERNELAPAR